MRISRYQLGCVLFNKDDVVDGFYIIREGEVIRKQSRVSIVGENQLLGEEEVLL